MTVHGSASHHVQTLGSPVPVPNCDNLFGTSWHGQLYGAVKKPHQWTRLSLSFVGCLTTCMLAQLEEQKVSKPSTLSWRQGHSA